MVLKPYEKCVQLYSNDKCKFKPHLDIPSFTHRIVKTQKYQYAVCWQTMERQLCKSVKWQKPRRAIWQDLTQLQVHFPEIQQRPIGERLPHTPAPRYNGICRHQSRVFNSQGQEPT